jgi:hypothetical protein
MAGLGSGSLHPRTLPRDRALDRHTVPPARAPGMHPAAACPLHRLRGAPLKSPANRVHMLAQSALHSSTLRDRARGRRPLARHYKHTLDPFVALTRGAGPRYGLAPSERTDGGGLPVSASAGDQLDTRPRLTKRVRSSHPNRRRVTWRQEWRKFRGAWERPSQPRGGIVTIVVRSPMRALRNPVGSRAEVVALSGPAEAVTGVAALVPHMPGSSLLALPQAGLTQATPLPISRIPHDAGDREHLPHRHRPGT